MDHPKAKQLCFAAAIGCVVFIGFALTFGMGEWKSAPATASAPPATTTQ